MKTISPLPLCALLAVSAVISASGSSSYPAIVKAEHAVAYYRLEELPGTTNAVDSSPSALHGSYTFNSVGYPQLGAPGIQTKSIVFAPGPNGATDEGFITIPWSALLSPVSADGVSGAPFSVELWVNPAVLPAQPLCPLAMCGPATGGASANGSGWDFSATPASPPEWQFTMRTQNGVSNLVSATPVATNQWTYLAATWDGSNATLYVNGAPERSAALSGYVPNQGFSGAIGAGPNTGHRGFIGAIDEVAFYAEALQGPSISNHFVVGIRRMRPQPAAVNASPTSQP